MKNHQKYLSLVASLVAISLGACNPNVSNNNLTSSPPETPQPSTTQPQPSQEEVTPTPEAEVTESPQAAAPNTTTVRIYQADNQCENLVPEQINVPVNNSVEAAVGKVIEEANNEEFEIASYDVQHNLETGVAVVDLQLSPDSERQFTSLSSCEQLALFGSLDRTLTENPQWNIREVEFTQQGEKIYL